MAPAISLQSYPIQADDIASQVIDDEAVLVLPRHGQIKVLNEVGARIWSLSDGNHSIQQITHAIYTEYAVTINTAEADTLAFVAALVKEQILTIRG
ncbi:MAG: PqqD family protein [Chloroflexaceae bacterium]|nr:PqqD family protein [Chloroflexaceae bacterium]